MSLLKETVQDEGRGNINHSRVEKEKLGKKYNYLKRNIIKEHYNKSSRLRSRDHERWLISNV